MENKLVLGLDVSTTTIGVCLMSLENGKEKILELTHISPKISSKIKGIETLFLKKQIFEDEFINKYKGVGITDIIIEEPLLGSNNINTVATLLKFSALVSDVIYKELGIVPTYMSSYDSRKYSFPELLAIRTHDKRGNIYPLKHIKKSIKNNDLTLFGAYQWDIAKKDVMLGLITDKFQDINWIYDKKNELKKENFDASDASVCCLAYINKLINGDVEPKILNVIENEIGCYIEYEVLIWDKIYKHKIKI